MANVILAVDVLCGYCLVLKVLKIEEKEFSEVCNLRIREMMNLSYSATDVAWSPLDGCLSVCLSVSLSLCLSVLYKSHSALLVKCLNVCW